MIEIKDFKGNVLKKVNAGNLGEANLRWADLRWADLRWANLRGADLGGANLGGANLGGADLRGANLGGADLRWADLRGADLRGADLGGADLGWADLGRADLGRANLGEANLGEANLGEANLRWADLGGAKINKTKWPSPTMVLLANWGKVSDKLCKALMRFDAQNHPDPHSFLRWAKTGKCPFNDVNFQRSANFNENKDLINRNFLRIKPKSAYELMLLLFKECCDESE